MDLVDEQLNASEFAAAARLAAQVGVQPVRNLGALLRLPCADPALLRARNALAAGVLLRSVGRLPASLAARTTHEAPAGSSPADVQAWEQGCVLAGAVPVEPRQVVAAASLLVDVAAGRAAEHCATPMVTISNCAHGPFAALWTGRFTTDGWVAGMNNPQMRAALIGQLRRRQVPADVETDGGELVIVAPTLEAVERAETLLRVLCLGWLPEVHAPVLPSQRTSPAVALRPVE